jgi:type I restriction enzyme S subunit
MSKGFVDHTQLGCIADTNIETLPPTTPPDFRFRYIDLSSVERGFIKWSEVGETTYAAAPTRARRVARPNDALFGTVRPNLKSHGLIGAGEPGPLVASTGFTVVRARKGISHPAFIFHSLMSNGVTAQAIRHAVGSSYPALNDGDVQRFEIFAPAYQEQTEIALVLDTLDIAIHQTDAIIAKLKAVKQGLLHDLLTRGIDANGELRPPQSEAPYLYKATHVGQVPLSWKDEPFGTLCISSAFGPRFPSGAYDEHGPLATLRTTDLDDEGNISLATMPRAAISPKSFAEHLLKVGDIVISRSGTCGVTGVFGGHDLPVVPGAFLIRFRLHDLRLAGFYRRFFNSALGRPQLERLAVGGVQKNIKGSDVLALRVPVLPPGEATEISERVQSVETDINANQVLLAKLQLQKSGLMDDLLTGRVRVTPLLKQATHPVLEAVV